MKTFDKIDQIKLKDKFIQHIIPSFNKNIPKKVFDWCNAVPMEICMILLLIATISATSIQESVRILSNTK